MSASQQSSNSSQLLGEQRSETQTPATSLNDKLQSQHTDIPDDDDSIPANLVRSICQLVAHVLTPRQVLGIIRVLKAITFCFLVLNILSNAMYIIFVHLASSNSVKVMAGGWRDTIIRVYGIGLCLLALAVEIDVSKLVKKFSGLKGFIARAMFMFLIAAITSSRPIYDKALYQQVAAAYSYNNNYDDAASSNNYVQVVDPASLIPSSAVNFQMVTAFVL
jgi:hypothetical protein